MDKIFLIMEEYSSYDVQSECLGFVETEEEAIEIMKKLAQELPIINEEIRLYTEFQGKVSIDFRVNCEMPMKIPKWPSGIGSADISKEMRDERDEIILHNENLMKKTQKLLDEKTYLFNRKCDKYITERNLSERITNILKGGQYNHILTHYYLPTNKFTI